jgi:hypothetical protein
MLLSNDEIYLNSYHRTSIDTDESLHLTANIDIIGKSGRNIEYSADSDFNINVGGQYRSIVRGNTSFLSDKIFIGSSSDNSEPMVGGTSLSIFLARLITALMGTPLNIRSQIPLNPRIRLPRSISTGIATTSHVITPMGPGVLNPQITTALITLYNELSARSFSGSPFSSQDNFVNLRNENALVELNGFKEGEQVETENSQWILSEQYYRVV